ncbi:MAG: hypothetical protein RMJ75_03795 [Nitrososphaerota archaeon]|nr:hypothetical protein [Nitrososphaerota archaeon]
MSEEPIDMIVVGFDELERALVSPTSGSGDVDLTSLVGKEVVYLDYNGNPWKGRVVEALEDVLSVEFDATKEGREVPGLGQGSLIRVFP